MFTIIHLITISSRIAHVIDFNVVNITGMKLSIVSYYVSS